MVIIFALVYLHAEVWNEACSEEKILVALDIRFTLTVIQNDEPSLGFTRGNLICLLKLNYNQQNFVKKICYDCDGNTKSICQLIVLLTPDKGKKIEVIGCFVTIPLFLVEIYEKDRSLSLG